MRVNNLLIKTELRLRSVMETGIIFISDSGKGCPCLTLRKEHMEDRSKVVLDHTHPCFSAPVVMT